jgi:hypothetical protein
MTVEEKLYFRSLVSLYEQQKLLEQDVEETDLGDEMPEEVVVDDTVSDGVEPDESQIEADSPEGSELDDADYLDEEASEGSPMGEELEVSESQKLAKLFDLFKSLLDYTESFYDSLENIDINLLDEEQNNEISEKKDKLFNLLEKQKSYIKEVFSSEKYEKSLYVYILLRTELMEIIRSIRNALGLDSSEEELKNIKDVNLKK